jgi:hypothetical protein
VFVLTLNGHFLGGSHGCSAQDGSNLTSSRFFLQGVVLKHSNLLSTIAGLTKDLQHAKFFVSVYGSSFAYAFQFILVRICDSDPSLYSITFSSLECGILP